MIEAIGTKLPTTQLPSATCIFPFFNESLHIEEVLSELVKIPFLKQIICVDDCSTDDSIAKISALLLPSFPQLELIQLPKNLGRMCPNPFVRASRVEMVISGERWLKKAELNRIFSTFNFKRFAIEAAINYYMIQEHKKCGWYQTSAENTFKYHKYGWISGYILLYHEFLNIFFSKYDLLGQLINFRPPQFRD